MKHPKNIAVGSAKYLALIVMLFVAASAAAVSFTQYPHAIKFIEADKLPIGMIKVECKAINVKENYRSCISHTMNHWANYRRALKNHPEIAERCYTNLRELDDYMLINKCIDASVEGNE